MNAFVYSAIYGSYERTVRPVPATLGVPALMITDSGDIARQATERGWLTLLADPPLRRDQLKPENGTEAIVWPMLRHKWWKCHPDAAAHRLRDLVGHRPGATDYDIAIWIDGSMTIVEPAFAQCSLEALGDDDWAMVPHPFRDCIYPEAEVSAGMSYRYDPAAVMRQSRFYRDVVGHPRHWGLPASGHSVRRLTPDVIEAGQRWWDECLNWSHQDQISLPVILRLYADRVRINYRLPWHLWWVLHEHGT